MSSVESAVVTRGLGKRYGSIEAVADVDLNVRRGEIYGFLGRNGAGKTTTIRMILGLVRPSSGSISVLGSTLAENRRGILARVGYLVETASAYPNLTVRENLQIQRRLTGAPASAVTRVIERFGLQDCADRRAGRLSLGNRQRLSLARSMVHDPELLILDEPVNGLDPAGIIEIRALLRRLADERGVTVFMSSHLLDEVEHLADRIGIIHEGRLIEEVDSRRLREDNRLGIEVQVDDVAIAERILVNELGYRDVTRSGRASLRIADPAARAARIARALVHAGVALEGMTPMEEDLEEHFMRITGRSLGREA